MWEPLIGDAGERDRLREVIVEIVAAIDAVPPERTVSELVDRALLHRYVEDVVPDEVSGELLGEAVEVLGAGPSFPGIFGGLAHLGWAIAHLTDGDDAVQVGDTVQAALLQRLEAGAVPEYDLIGGLVGIGVFALERGEAGRRLAARVIDELAARSRPRGDGLAWFTSPERLPSWQRAIAPAGYWNLGLAHGVAGVVAVLARFVVQEADPRARAMLEEATRYLLGAAAPSPQGRFPAWLVEGAAAEASGSPRLAWCYNDLGTALALSAAAQACDQPAWAATALALAHDAAGRDLDQAACRDAGLCHGAAGAAHLFHRMWRASGDADLAAAARRWVWETIALRSEHGIAGFPKAGHLPGEAPRWEPATSFLEGAGGVALALHAAISESEPGWDRVLLVDV